MAPSNVVRNRFRSLLEWKKYRLRRRESASLSRRNGWTSHGQVERTRQRQDGISNDFRLKADRVPAPPEDVVRIFGDVCFATSCPPTTCGRSRSSRSADADASCPSRCRSIRRPANPAIPGCVGGGEFRPRSKTLGASGVPICRFQIWFTATLAVSGFLRIGDPVRQRLPPPCALVAPT